MFLGNPSNALRDPLVGSGQNISAEVDQGHLVTCRGAHLHQHGSGSNLKQLDPDSHHSGSVADPDPNPEGIFLGLQDPDPLVRGIKIDFFC